MLFIHISIKQNLLILTLIVPGVTEQRVNIIRPDAGCGPEQRGSEFCAPVPAPRSASCCQMKTCGENPPAEVPLRAPGGAEGTEGQSDCGTASNHSCTAAARSCLEGAQHHRPGSPAPTGTAQPRTISWTLLLTSLQTSAGFAEANLAHENH